MTAQLPRLLIAKIQVPSFGAVSIACQSKPTVPPSAREG